MLHRITVTRIEKSPALTDSGQPVVQTETEVFRQTVEELDLSKIIFALNKPQRIRRSRNTTAARSP